MSNSASIASSVSAPFSLAAHRSLMESLMLAALAPNPAANDFPLVPPLGRRAAPILPSPTAQFEMLMALRASEQILIRGESITDDPYLRELTLREPVDWQNAEFVLSNAGDPETSYDEAVSLAKNLAEPEHWSMRWREELVDVWRELAEQECIAFFAALLKTFGCSYQEREKTELNIRSALRFFSIGQVCQLLQTAADEGKAWAEDNGSTSTEAAGAMLGLFEYHLESTINQDTPVSSLRRSLFCPESSVATLFAYHLTGLEGRYWECVPLPGNLPDHLTGEAQ